MRRDTSVENPDGLFFQCSRNFTTTIGYATCKFPMKYRLCTFMYISIGLFLDNFKLQFNARFARDSLHSVTKLRNRRLHRLKNLDGSFLEINLGCRQFSDKETSVR